MKDSELLRKAAIDLVWHMGARAAHYCEGQAVISAGNGDMASETTWLDLANEARLVGAG